MTGVTGGIASPDFITFDTGATTSAAVGRLRWDSANGTARLGMIGGNVESQLGQTIDALVHNAEATSLSKGEVVYLFSATGDRASVKRAANTGDATSAKTIGVVAESIAAGLLIAAAWGKVPLPTLPSVAPQVTVVTPSDELQRLVTPVADALAGLSAADRALWAALWTRAATVAAGDAVTAQVAFADTRALRDFTALSVDIGWRRIGKHAPGSQESLRAAVEAAYGSALGKANESLDSNSVSTKLRITLRSESPSTEVIIYFNRS